MDEVLIVGAGPTGLTAAAELYRHGVPCRVVDGASGSGVGSGELALHSRTLEVFEDMGILDAVLAQGHRVHGANAYVGGNRILHVGFDELDAPYPFILTLPQAETETILREHLTALGGKVEKPVTLTGLRPNAEGVVAELRHADGREENASFRWLLGCDGANSTVREALGLKFSGETHAERLLLGDMTIDWSYPHDEGNAFLSAEGLFLAIPMPGERRYRVVTHAPAGAEVEPTLEWFQECAKVRGPGEGATLSDPTWVTTLDIEERIVSAYGKGRVFLAGSAAHIHSPLGGQGINLGIQDAYNLAWKLSLTLRNRALPSLLRSYEAERRPIAVQVVGDTCRATRVVMLRRSVTQSVRNYLGSFLATLEVVQRRVTTQMGQLAFNYRYSPIVGEARSSVLSTKVGPDLTNENPNLTNWLDFNAAPAPGDRAPDLEFSTGPGDQTTRAFELFQGPHHTLLLFDGRAPTEKGYEKLEDIARRVDQVYGDRIKPYVVVLQDAAPAAIDDTKHVILDPEGALHSRYGASAECLYLIRPDNYVGFRAQPASEQGLWAYLHQIFPLE